MLIMDLNTEKMAFMLAHNVFQATTGSLIITSKENAQGAASLIHQ